MSFPAHPAYKDSGVEWLGQVPEHWSVAPIKYAVTCNDEVLRESTAADFLIEYLEISDVDLTAGVKGTTSLEFGVAPSRARRIIRSGDVVVSTVRTYLKAVAQIENPPSNLVASTGFAVLRPSSVHSSRFIGYAVQAESFIAEVISRSVGISYPAINASDLISIKAALPPLSEQVAVSKFLDRETIKIDALLHEQEQLVVLLAEKRQAAIAHFILKGLSPRASAKVSGEDWLAHSPEHWRSCRVKHVLRGVEQGWSPQCENRPADENEWGVLKVGCVNGGLFSSQENKALPEGLERIASLTLHEGDLLVSRANTKELVGSAAVVDKQYERLMLCDKLYRLIVDSNQCCSRFLSLYLGAKPVRAQIELGATGASDSMQNISQSTILELPIRVPPLPEQASILSRIDEETKAIDSLILKVESAMQLLKERRAALISSAVTGKIDVRGMA